MKKHKFLFFSLIIIFLLFLISNIDFYKLFSLPDNFYISFEEIEKSNNKKEFGDLISISLKQEDIKTDKGNISSGEIVFKLFGIIPIKTAKVNILPEEEVYVGGKPLGLSFQSKGVVVVSNSMVDTSSSKFIKNQHFKNGDIIKEINGKSIETVNDINKVLKGSYDNKVKIKYISDNQEKINEIQLLKDTKGEYKLGIWVQDKFSGIGTLTFVKKEDENQFAALGHPITNGQNGNILSISEGEVYDCSLINIVKGEKNVPGELHCAFTQAHKKGVLEKNTNVGIFGHLDNLEDIIDQNLSAKLGGRLSVKPGNAKIISGVSGILEEYDIEIIKASYQTKSSDKSMVFRVKDKRLIDLTGGIVQGMSGSPIIQDGKIIGAVTHVFVTDPTKGFAVYSDWMIEQMDSK